MTTRTRFPPSSRRPLRRRLTLIYSGLFLLAGAVLLTITYVLVAQGGPNPKKPQSETAQVLAFKRICNKALTSGSTNPNMIHKCEEGFHGAAAAGAASQRSLDLGHLLTYSVLALAVMALLSAGAGWMMAGRALRPVQAITAAARRASDSNLSERLGLTGPYDELKELADTFDAMLERLDSAFSSQRHFVANASHELRTPLTLIRTSIDVTLAKAGRTPAHLEQMALEVRHAADNAEAIIEALLTLARSEAAAGLAEPLDLAVVADGCVDAASPAIADAGLRADTEFDAALTSGDAVLIERMIANLVDNAIRHNVSNGWLRVSTGVRDGFAFVEVTNSGEQVPAGVERSLFEPFRRLSDRTNGSSRHDRPGGPGGFGGNGGYGLGLSIARSVATAHRGTISARSRAGGGLDVLVLLPVVRDGE